MTRMNWDRVNRENRSRRSGPSGPQDRARRQAASRQASNFQAREARRARKGTNPDGADRNGPGSRYDPDDPAWVRIGYDDVPPPRPPGRLIRLWRRLDDWMNSS